MVKSGGEPAVEAATVSSHTTQSPHSPERNLPLIPRPKTKRAGTPFPERGRSELKRAGLETISGVSRIKKKMIFEMAEELLAGKNDEGTASPEGELPSDGYPRRTFAQMAKPGPFETATGHLLLLDHERYFAAGISDDDLVDPPFKPSSREVDEPKQESTSNLGEGRGSPEVEQACVGEVLNASAQINEGSTPTCDLEDSDFEGVAGTSPAPASRNGDVTAKEMVLVNHQHVEGTREHVHPCLDVGVTCEELDACDSQMREKTKLTLHGEGSVGSLWVSGNLNSNSTPCATHPPPIPIGHEEHKGDRTPDAQRPENSPEKPGAAGGSLEGGEITPPPKGVGERGRRISHVQGL
ncbi:uncharacterized protein LOC121776308 [Salvia splendens]|uniref:uncharacterized protein LOC121776308 n=1 Tax=Salvia splendens TaxID=180675 RepID=UPI001C279063|nr:uncharacterized protein LOC121776308 [Salvia splendens]